MSKEYVSNEWTGKDGKTYRSVRFWITDGWSNSFLQVKRSDGWYLV
jgi:hypothetical protein